MLCACPEAGNYSASDRGVFKGAGSHLKKCLTRDLEFLTMWSRLEAQRGRERGWGWGWGRGPGGACRVGPAPARPWPVSWFLGLWLSPAAPRPPPVPRTWAGKGFRPCTPPSAQVLRGPRPGVRPSAPRTLSEGKSPLLQSERS